MPCPRALRSSACATSCCSALAGLRLAHRGRSAHARHAVHDHAGACTRWRSVGRDPGAYVAARRLAHGCGDGSATCICASRATSCRRRSPRRPIRTRSTLRMSALPLTLVRALPDALARLRERLPHVHVRLSRRTRYEPCGADQRPAAPIRSSAACPRWLAQRPTEGVAHRTVGHETLVMVSATSRPIARRAQTCACIAARVRLVLPPRLVYAACDRAAVHARRARLPRPAVHLDELPRRSAASAKAPARDGSTLGRARAARRTRSRPLPDGLGPRGYCGDPHLARASLGECLRSSRLLECF